MTGSETTAPNRPRRALVLGASGFVGSHVVRKLAERSPDPARDVRVYLRRTSKTIAIDDLDVERCYGDLYDGEALRAAMADRDVVYYCVVDTRFYLRDPLPLFETNVAGLQRVLDIAADADLHRFVFCSTIGTIALGDGRTVVNEDMPFDWGDRGGPYIESRRQAEELVLRYVRERGLPAVVMCVSNPYGPRDWQPMQGMLIQNAAYGRIPVYVKGVSTEVVGVEDVADAFLLAGEHGGIGERYIISETYMSMREMFEIAASAVGARAPRFGVPLAALYAGAWTVDKLGRLLGPVLRRPVPMNTTGVRLLHIMPPADHSKAVRELGWQPRPAAESIAAAARFYVENRGRITPR